MAAQMIDVILDDGFNHSDDILNIFLRLTPTIAKGSLSIIQSSGLTQVYHPCHTLGRWYQLQSDSSSLFNI